MAEELARTGGAADSLLHRLRLRRQQAEPYRGDDATGPLNVYGRTKLEGEQAIAGQRVRARHSAYDVGVRHSRQELSADGLAPGAREGRAAHGRRSVRRADLGADHGRSDRHHPGQMPGAQELGPASWRSGLFHLTAGGQTSWAGFAQAILEDYEALLVAGRRLGEFGGAAEGHERRRRLPLRSIRRQPAGRAIRCCRMRKDSRPIWDCHCRIGAVSCGLPCRMRFADNR